MAVTPSSRKSSAVSFGRTSASTSFSRNARSTIIADQLATCHGAPEQYEKCVCEIAPTCAAADSAHAQMFQRAKKSVARDIGPQASIDFTARNARVDDRRKE